MIDPKICFIPLVDYIYIKMYMDCNKSNMYKCGDLLKNILNSEHIYKICFDNESCKKPIMHQVSSNVIYDNIISDLYRCGVSGILSISHICSVLRTNGYDCGYEDESTKDKSYIYVVSKDRNSINNNFTCDFYIFDNGIDHISI